MQDVQAVLFDLYNTLVFNPSKDSPYRRFFSAVGIDGLEELKEAKKIVLTEELESFGAIAKRLGVQRAESFQMIATELNQEISQVKVDDGVPEVLVELRRRGLRLGLISNLATPYKRPVFDLGLDQFFERMIFSCDVGCRKPDPEIFRLACSALAVEPNQVLMIGDNLNHDYRAAKAVGMSALLLSRNIARHDAPNIGSLTDLLLIFPK